MYNLHVLEPMHQMSVILFHGTFELMSRVNNHTHVVKIVCRFRPFAAASRALVIFDPSHLRLGLHQLDSNLFRDPSHMRLGLHIRPFAMASRASVASDPSHLRLGLHLSSSSFPLLSQRWSLSYLPLHLQRWSSSSFPLLLQRWSFLLVLILFSSLSPPFRKPSRPSRSFQAL